MFLNKKRHTAKQYGLLQLASVKFHIDSDTFRYSKNTLMDFHQFPGTQTGETATLLWLFISNVVFMQYMGTSLLGLLDLQNHESTIECSKYLQICMLVQIYGCIKCIKKCIPKCRYNMLLLDFICVTPHVMGRCYTVSTEPVFNSSI